MFIKLFIYIFPLVCKGQAQDKIGMGKIALLRKIFSPFSYTKMSENANVVSSTMVIAFQYLKELNFKAIYPVLSQTVV